MYTGWTLYDKVKLVIRTKCCYGYEYPQAYLVDTKNNKQLKSAINWAKGYGDIEPKIIETDNCGFKLTIIDSAGSSSQGGKLSFWNCLIEKDSEDIKCIIGIDSTLLLKLIKSTSFFNGECAEELFFARCQGGVGMLSYKMKEYSDALKDMIAKKTITTKKTSKWKIGCNYKTLTIDSMYLGKISRFINIDIDLAYRHMGKHSHIAKLDKERIHHICESAVHFSDNHTDITKMSELICNWKKDIKNKTEELMHKAAYDGDDRVSFLDLINTVPLFSHKTMGSKLPARQQGDIHIDVDIDIDKAYTEVIELMQESALKLHNIGVSGLEYYVDELLIRAGDAYLDNLTEHELRLLNILECSDNVNVAKIGLVNKDIEISNNYSYEELLETTEDLINQSKYFLEKLEKETKTCKK